MKPSHAWSRRDDSHAHQPGHVRAFAVRGISLKSVKPRVSVPRACPRFYEVIYPPGMLLNHGVQAHRRRLLSGCVNRSPALRHVARMTKRWRHSCCPFWTGLRARHVAEITEAAARRFRSARAPDAEFGVGEVEGTVFRRRVWHITWSTP
jgi:hypothetical protein